MAQAFDPSRDRPAWIVRTVTQRDPVSKTKQTHKEKEKNSRWGGRVLLHLSRAASTPLVFPNFTVTLSKIQMNMFALSKLLGTQVMLELRS